MMVCGSDLLLTPYRQQSLFNVLHTFMGSCCGFNQFELPISLVTETSFLRTSNSIISWTHQQIEIGTVLVRENNAYPVIVIYTVYKESSLRENIEFDNIINF